MKRHLRTFLRSVLILIVAVGPLRAQAVFTCSMMDMVMEECCCNDHGTGKEGVDSERETAAGYSEVPCCDRSVGLQVDEDAQQDTRIVKPLEIRTDVDPPQAVFASYERLSLPQENSLPIDFGLNPTARRSGIDTYLITQRLRI